jgi:hypothetical protein
MCWEMGRPVFEADTGVFGVNTDARAGRRAVCGDFANQPGSIEDPWLWG